MITKLIALLTLLFAPLHISNNIVKYGAGQKCEALPSRPQETTLLETKKARDYNEYFANNSFQIMSSEIFTQPDFTIQLDRDLNTITLNGVFTGGGYNFVVDIQRIDITYQEVDNITHKPYDNYFYIKAHYISGTFNNTQPLHVEATFTDSFDYNLNVLYKSSHSGNGFKGLFYDNNDYLGLYEYVKLWIAPGNYHNATFSFYIFAPSNVNTYIPGQGIIYTDPQMDDIINDELERKNKESYPLYNSTLTYTNSQETININGYKPPHYNYVTFQDLYNIVKPSLNGDFSTTNTITFHLNSGVFVRDLYLFATNVNKIQLFRTNGDIFYTRDFNSSLGSFDLSTIQLNETQKKYIINKVVLTYNQYRINDDISLMIENKVNSFSYQAGFDSGKNEGEQIGYNNGYTNGTRDGYNEGYEVGRNENIANKNYNAFTLVSSAFSSLGKLLNVEIYNGLTIGVIVCIPIIFCVVLFVIKMIKG